MSIDARVAKVVLHSDGSGELRLEDRPPAPGRPGTSGIAGQAALFFQEAPPDVRELEGKDVWGGADTLLLGETLIADRTGYTGIRFVVPSIRAVVLGDPEK